MRSRSPHATVLLTHLPRIATSVPVPYYNNAKFLGIEVPPTPCVHSSDLSPESNVPTPPPTSVTMLTLNTSTTTDLVATPTATSCRSLSSDASCWSERIHLLCHCDTVCSSRTRSFAIDTATGVKQATYSLFLCHHGIQFEGPMHLSLPDLNQ